MCMNQISIYNLLQCIANLVNTSHSGKPGFSKRSGLLIPVVYWFFTRHALRVYFKIWGVRMSLSNLICPLLVSWCVVHSWQTSEQLLQCSCSDFFGLCSVILGQSWFPVYSFGVFYWAHDQRNRVTCSRARSSTMNSWYVFVLSSSPQGDECALQNVFLWNYF